MFIAQIGLFIVSLIPIQLSAAPEPGPGNSASTGSINQDQVNDSPVNTSPTVLKLSLEDALRIGIKNNLDIKTENIEREIQLRKLVIEKAVFDPYFNLGFTYAKNRDPTVSPIELSSAASLTGVTLNPFATTNFKSGIRTNTILGSSIELGFTLDGYDNPAATLNALNPHWRSGLGFSITQPLLKNAWYNVNSAGIDIAKNSVKIADDKHESAITNTLSKIATAFWELTFAYKNNQAKSKALELVRLQLEIEKEKVKIGNLAAIDTATTESQLAKRQKEYDDSQALIQQSRDDLLFEMNFMRAQTEKSKSDYSSSNNPFKNIDLVPTTEPISTEVNIDRQTAIETALQNRPEYHQIEGEIKNQMVAIRVAQNQLLPSLDFSASWNQSGIGEPIDDSFESVEDGNFYSWSVGLQLEIPLSLRGPKKAYENTKSRLIQLQLQKKKLENTIVLEVDQSIRDLDYGHRSIINSRKQVKAIERLLEAEKERFKNGKSTSYTIVQIENDLIEAQADELRALADFEKAKIGIKKAMGTLYPTNEIPQP